MNPDLAIVREALEFAPVGNVEALAALDREEARLATVTQERSGYLRDFLIARMRSEAAEARLAETERERDEAMATVAKWRGFSRLEERFRAAEAKLATVAQERYEQFSGRVQANRRARDAEARAEAAEARLATVTAERAGYLRDFLTARMRSEAAEARATRLEGALDEAWFERRETTLTNGEKDYFVWCRRCGVNHQRPHHCPARAALAVAPTADPAEYSPEFQDEYRRLWHEAARERDEWKAKYEAVALTGQPEEEA
jgi:rubrerythrin